MHVLINLVCHVFVEVQASHDSRGECHNRKEQQTDVHNILGSATRVVVHCERPNARAPCTVRGLYTEKDF